MYLLQGNKRKEEETDNIFTVKIARYLVKQEYWKNEFLHRKIFTTNCNQIVKSFVFRKTQRPTLELGDHIPNQRPRDFPKV